MQDIMTKTENWIRPRMTAPNNKFNWFLMVENGVDFWRVRPSAIGTGYRPWGNPSDPNNPPNGEGITEADVANVNTPIPPTPSGNRSRNTIQTTCLYSDFKLKFNFRCPNARNQFTLCQNAGGKDARLHGPKNWGNSGVKIFNLSGGAGLEVQILDSYNIGETIPNNPDTPDEDVLVHTKIKPCPSKKPQGKTYFVPATNGGLPFGQICGSIYNKRVATANPVKQAVGWPLPTGEWNSMEICFMAARYSDQQKTTKEKLPTITVIINGVTVQNKVSVDGTLSSQVEEDLDCAGNAIYNSNWYREHGSIILQEHDNIVEFKNIEINPCWLPKSGGSFDSDWQNEPE